MRHRWSAFGACVVGALARRGRVAVADGDDDGGATARSSEAVSGSVSMMAIWTGAEQASFQAVIDGFKEQYPNVDVKYTSARRQPRRPLLSTAVAGRQPARPRRARPARPHDATSRSRARSSRSTSPAATIVGQLRRVGRRRSARSTASSTALIFKGGQQVDRLVQRRRLQGRRRRAAEDLGRPRSSHGDTLKAVGHHAVLDRRRRTAGRSPTCSRTSTSARPGRRSTTSSPTHEIPWTDQSVKDALTTMADIVGDVGQHRRRHRRARCRRTSRPRSTQGLHATRPKAAHGRSRATSSPASSPTDDAGAGDGLQRLHVPVDQRLGARRSSAAATGRHVQGQPGGARRSSSTSRRPRRPRSGPKRGGFSSPNKNVDASVYPDEITRTTASALADAETFRFDLSDLQPAAFGGTAGQGLCKVFQDFLAEPERRRRDHAADGGRRREGVRRLGRRADR